MKLVMILPILLCACSTVVPVTRKFPELPPSLIEPCQELVKVTGTSIIDLIKTNIENYRRGVECRVKHSTTTEWYNNQKILFTE